MPKKEKVLVIDPTLDLVEVRSSRSPSSSSSASTSSRKEKLKHRKTDLLRKLQTFEEKIELAAACAPAVHRLRSQPLDENNTKSKAVRSKHKANMYILKPYLCVLGVALLVVSYFMVVQPNEALVHYLSFLSSSTEEASLWLKSFKVESNRSAMWQSPMYPLMIHLVQASGCVVFCLGALLALSVTFGSSKRFTEGSCLLIAMLMYEFLSGSTQVTTLKLGLYAAMALLVVALLVNRAVKMSPKSKQR